MPSMSTSSGPMAATLPTDRFGHVEARGIDYIPISERHGAARELFAVWAASNTTYLYIVLGGVLVSLGLNAWQALLVVVLGNLFWGLVGYLSISGPSSGTPSFIVMRAMFGVHGNRINAAILGWGISVAYEAINLSIGSLAGFALLTVIGIHVGLTAKLAIVAVNAAVTLSISVYGHATIVRLSWLFTAALGICVALLAVFTLPHVNMHFVPPSAPHGAALLAAGFAGFTIIASAPLSWGTGADYARYLPTGTSKNGIIWWTALGGFLPAVLLGGLGVLAGTAIDMTNPQTSFAGILPAWFYPIFLLVIIAGSITNNILTAYSSGLALQAVGFKVSRAVTVFFDGIVGIAIACYALFVSNFIDTLSNILSLSVAILGPCLAIYAMDIWLRGNWYDGIALNDETPESKFWFSHGFNLAGMISMIAGTAVAVLCVNTTVFVGPVSNLLDGADISSLTGPLVAAGLYATLSVRARSIAASAPTAALIADTE